MSEDATSAAVATAPPAAEEVKATEPVAGDTKTPPPTEAATETTETTETKEPKLPSPDSSTEKSKEHNGSKNFHEKRDFKNRGNNHRNTHNKNVKTQFDKLPESNDPDEIRAQVRYHISSPPRSNFY
jgi:hypothetical protein